MISLGGNRVSCSFLLRRSTSDCGMSTLKGTMSESAIVVGGDHLPTSRVICEIPIGSNTAESSLICCAGNTCRDIHMLSEVNVLGAPLTYAIRFSMVCDCHFGQLGRCERKPHFGTTTTICKSFSVFLDIIKDYLRSPKIFNQLLWNNRHLSITQSKAVSTHCGSLNFAIDRRPRNASSSLQHLSYEISHFCVFLMIAASLR